MKFKYFLFNLIFIILLFSMTSIKAEGEKGKKNSTLLKTSGIPSYSKFNINNISTWFRNDGESDIDPNGNSGLIYPKGSKKWAVFTSGFLWGGEVDGEFRLGGSVFRQGTVPGRIFAPGVAANPTDPDVRIYRVRRDYLTGNILAEVKDEGLTIEEIIAQYEKDWNEWPANQGAPFEDVNNDGVYSPDFDIPGIPGADQTLWFVANDLDVDQSKFFYGTLPMGIEQQVTIWGYNSVEPLGNVFFRKYILINKNSEGKALTNMYASMWSDPDIGDAGDDFVGCDTTLSLGFAYNGTRSDAVYSDWVPAIGFALLQGPIVKSKPTETAIFNNKKMSGYLNLPMNSFYFFVGGDAVYADPAQGNYERGALAFRNLFQGKIALSGQPFKDPNTGEITKFTLSGDPVTRTGWIDGILHPPGDRRLGLASGPFNMEFGDTQEVIIAEIVAGAQNGIDKLAAVTLLKEYTKEIQKVYENFFYINLIPNLFTPLKNGENVAITPTFMWSAKSEAESYTLQISTTKNFSSFVYNKSGITINQIQIPPLLNSTTYYWRVIATNKNGTSLFSEVRSFTTATDINNPTLKVNPNSLTVNNSSGLAYINITNSSFGNMNWEAVSSDTNWLKIISGSNGINTGQIVLYHDQNSIGERKGYVIIKSLNASGTPKSVEIIQETAKCTVITSSNPDTTGMTIGDSIFDYGERITVTAVPFNEYKFVDWTENDSIVSTERKYNFTILQNRSLTANFKLSDSIIIKISEMDGDVVIDEDVGLRPVSVGPNGYIVSNRTGRANSALFQLDYDRYNYWGIDDVVIDFSESSLAYNYRDGNIYQNVITKVVQYLPFAVYRVKYPSKEKIRLFTGFEDSDNNNVWSIITYYWGLAMLWGKPTYEDIFAWQGYDALGNEINYDPSNIAQYISENSLQTSANTLWNSSAGKFKYPFLTNTLFVLYNSTARLPDSNRQIRFFTSKPEGSVDVHDENLNYVPRGFKLSQNYPNPFNPNTIINYQVNKTTFVSIKIYDILSREIKTLVNSEQSAGSYKVEFDASDLVSGVYIYRIQTKDFSDSKKMILMK